MLEAKDLAHCLQRPVLHEAGTHPLWTDPHISGEMLAAHLDPESDSASRRPAFIDAAARFITAVAPPQAYPRLLDLGCGPGLYAERFAGAGYAVTGVDFSARAIAYARASAAREGRTIAYHHADYLSWRCEETFDVITLIYCDFGALFPADRARLLSRAMGWLRPGGMLLLDAFTPVMMAAQPESTGWTFAQAGFWSPVPYLCLNACYHYPEAQSIARKHVVLTAGEARVYHVWEHFFAAEELRRVFLAAGFGGVRFYGDLTGRPFDEKHDTLCAVATK